MHTLDSTRETLVALGVVVLEADLELDRLDKVALLLAIGLGEELFHGHTDAGNRKFGAAGSQGQTMAMQVSKHDDAPHLVFTFAARL